MNPSAASHQGAIKVFEHTVFYQLSLLPRKDRFDPAAGFNVEELILPETQSGSVTSQQTLVQVKGFSSVTSPVTHHKHPITTSHW